MIRIYPHKTVLAKTDGLVYKVADIEVYNNGQEYHIVNLELVCGWDYIDPDESDALGWCKPDRFVEEVQHDMFPLYYLYEGVIGALEDRGYEVLEEGEEKKFEKFL